MAEDGSATAATRRGGRRKGSGKRADASAPWVLRAIQALADGSRWSIVRYLSDDREATVGTVARELGLSVACTSKHLSILHASGLIEIARSGREARCRLARGATEAAGLLRALGIADAGRSDRPAPPEASLPSRPGGAVPELEPSRYSVIKRYSSKDLDDFLL